MISGVFLGCGFWAQRDTTGVEAGPTASWPPGLDDLIPTPLVAPDRLLLFTCHWQREVRVAAPEDASAQERALFERALQAWEAVLAPLRIVRVVEDPQIAVRFAGEPGSGAHTASDCLAERAPQGEQADLPVQAELQRARITVRREGQDAWGRPRRLDTVEVFAAMLHEMGHALGFQGHVRRRASVMQREAEAVRRRAGRVLEGAALDEPEMRALYGSASGRLLAERRLPAGSTAGIAARAPRFAEHRRWWVRVGDSAARLFAHEEPTLAFYLADPAELRAGRIDWPAAFSWLPPAAPTAR